ncbi:MAG TPA: response regulator [Verrucomicrobiae bacterium]|nr:response regulator [Verrucomicrobiae bacterium]
MAELYHFITGRSFDEQTLLLAEDSADDVLIMRNAFEMAGVLNPIQVVSDGEAAVAYLSGSGDYAGRHVYPLPGAIFLDLKMPKKDGLEVLAWVRQQEKLKLLTVYVLSASSREADIAQAISLGVSGYLVKPSKYSDLVEMLKAWHRLARFQSIMVPCATE